MEHIQDVYIYIRIHMYSTVDNTHACAHMCMHVYICIYSYIHIISLSWFMTPITMVYDGIWYIQPWLMGFINKLITGGTL